MTHNVEIVDKEEFDNAVKIYLKITIDGDKCGYPELDGEVEKFNFDIDYERYRDNEIVKRDAKSWAKKVINKRIEQHDKSESPVGETLNL